MAGLFGGVKTPKPPPDPRPVRMPVKESADVQRAVMRKRATVAQRSGRQSTILSDMTGSSGDKLGA